MIYTLLEASINSKAAIVVLVVSGGHVNVHASLPHSIFVLESFISVVTGRAEGTPIDLGG